MEEQKTTQEKQPVGLREHQRSIGELWGADPDCWHELDPDCWSGIRCTKCGGWFCY
jgi:hypothetical protein